MSNENSSWGQQSQSDSGEQLDLSPNTTPVVPSEPALGNTLRGASLVGDAGHYAVILAGAKIAGDGETYITSDN